MTLPQSIPFPNVFCINEGYSKLQINGGSELVTSTIRKVISRSLIEKLFNGWQLEHIISQIKILN